VLRGLKHGQDEAKLFLDSSQGEVSMAELMEVIKERRSIRRYQDREVSQELLQQVIEALKWTPSWANTQCWELIVVTDQGMKERLQETVSKRNPATKAMVKAPVVLALCGKKEQAGYYHGQATTKFGDWFMFDLGLATQNMCLAAHSLALGTVIVGFFDHDRARELLAVPADYEVVVLIPLGYPAKTPSAPRRRESAEFVHLNHFQAEVGRHAVGSSGLKAVISGCEEQSGPVLRRSHSKME
jgi:nitroreductase